MKIFSFKESYQTGTECEVRFYADGIILILNENGLSSFEWRVYSGVLQVRTPPDHGDWNRCGNKQWVDQFDSYLAGLIVD